MNADLHEAKQRLPLPTLMRELGLGGHTNKSARCPFHEDRRNSFSVSKAPSGLWRWKCFAGCGSGDEITFLEKLNGISNKEAVKSFLEMAGVAQTRKGLSVRNAIGETPPIDWQRCVGAFSAKDLKWLSDGSPIGAACLAHFARGYIATPWLVCTMAASRFRYTTAEKSFRRITGSKTARGAIIRKAQRYDHSCSAS
jgi:hypothetical protein